MRRAPRSRLQYFHLDSIGSSRSSRHRSSVGVDLCVDPCPEFGRIAFGKRATHRFAPTNLVNLAHMIGSSSRCLGPDPVFGHLNEEAVGEAAVRLGGERASLLELFETSE